MILFLARMEHKNALKIWKTHLHSLWDWFFFLNAFFSLRIIIGHSHNQRNTEYYADT